GNTAIFFTSTGDGSFTTADRWVVTDEFSNTAGGDPAVLFAFGGTDGGVGPSAVSAPTGFIGCTHVVTIDPFDDRILSYFFEIDPNATDAGADGPDFNTLASRESFGFFLPNFSGRDGRELNFDTYEDWVGNTSNDLLVNSNWEFGVVPFNEAARIRFERDAFVPQDRVLRLDAFELDSATVALRPGSEIIVRGRCVLDDSSVVEIDGGFFDSNWLILSDGTISVRSPGGRIGSNSRSFPALRNSGTVEIVGTPFSPEFASLDINDDALNLDQWVMRGAAELAVDELENRANFDVVFANATLSGDLDNTASGLVTVSGASQFNQVGDVENDGTFVVTGDSSYSLLGSLQGNGIEGPGGPGTAGTVFIRDGVSGRSDPGGIRFDGPLSLGSAATTTLRLGGTAAGVDYDQLIVAGTLNAAGTIRFESVGGFVPQPGDVFQVLGFDSVQGAFATIELDPTLAAAGIETANLLVDGTIGVPGSDCPADVNGDGEADGSDFFAWVSAFGSQAPECDVNTDGFCTGSDFFAWVSAFSQGCP
ncbi:MAG: GC-type dockerin domain-anchored protein, partial [Planctomycetota bacterium]